MATVLRIFWSTFLSAALSLILGKAKDAVMQIVATVENKDLTGEQKNAEVLRLVKDLYLVIPKSVLNLAIEIAVNLVKGWKP